MFSAKWAWVALFLVLGSGSARAQEGACEPAAAAVPAAILPAVVLEQSMILPAVLKWAPGEESPLAIQFAKAPAIVPGNLCEARCLTGLRRYEFLLDLCVARCTSDV